MTRQLIWLILLLTSSVFAQKFEKDTSASTGIVYGDNHAFAIAAPKGWVLDNSSGVSQGLHAVFYPKGGSWKQSPAVMYANTASKSVRGNETIDKLISYDVAHSREQDSTVKVIDLSPLTTKDGKTAFIKVFVYSNYEAVAYIDEEKIVALICLSARTKSDYDEAMSSFKELVASYFFITKDVSFPK